MKSRDEHLKQAKNNENFADSQLQTAQTDALTWAVTALFYSAAHYGRAYVVVSGATTITSHVGFESYFHRCWTTKPDIFPLYRRLKDDSEAGRYDCVSYSASEVVHLRDNYLVPFRDAARAALGLS